MNKIAISLDQIEESTCRALVAHGAAPWVAAEVAKAVREAEAQGNIICGLYYLESYCTQLKSGRVDGNAEPVVTRPKPAAIHVDARFGFAQAAFHRGLPDAVTAARENGVATLAISHAHTCTSLGYFTRQIGTQGLIAIGVTNAPACVSPPGGSRAVLGTNPIAMAVPDEEGGVAFQFDQSTSAIAIGKIRMAAAAGESIPPGWAVDEHGQPTQDAKAALRGSLVSAGGYKGFGFGLMAEVLASAFTGSVSSIDAPPLKTAEGSPHNLGQTYLLIEPTVFCGDAFWQNLGQLENAVSAQPGARLPGSSPADQDPVELENELWQLVCTLTA